MDVNSNTQRARLTAMMLATMASLLLMLAVFPAVAHANRVIDDWREDGIIDGTYTAAQLQAALDSANPEELEYSDLVEVLGVAMQEARKSQSGTSSGETRSPSNNHSAGAAGSIGGGGDGGDDSGGGSGSSKSSGGSNDISAGNDAGDQSTDDPSSTPISRAQDSISDNTRAARLWALDHPLSILLASVGSILLLAAGAQAVRKRMRARSATGAGFSLRRKRRQKL